MKKRNKANPSVLLFLIIVLVFTIVVWVGKSSNGDKVLSYKSDKDKTENNNKGIGGSKDETDDDDNYLDSPKFEIVSPTIAYPTYTPPTVSPSLTPTYQITPTMALPVDETVDTNITNDNENQLDQDSNEPEVFVVPVSERSVVTSGAGGGSGLSVTTVPTRTIFKRIENKIRNVGSGQFLTKPKTSIAPVQQIKELDSAPPVALGPDSSIFYMLTDTELLLGAVDKEDKRINVDEVELRGAEITMDKVLKKKGLDLGVSSEGSLVLTEGGVRAYFNMPVFVDVFNHDISLDTAEGRKEIKVTPAKAVASAIESGYLESVDSQAQMTLGVKDGQLVYRLQGNKDFNVFGRFGTKGVQYVYVSVDTGEVAEGDQPLLSRFLKLISL